ncbi:MAG: hypothetical protein ACYC1C_19735, partial [Chloroflexota bacterium]
YTFSLRGAALLFVLFTVQLVLPDVRFAAGVLYVVMAAGLLALSPARRRGLLAASREAFRSRGPA